MTTPTRSASYSVRIPSDKVPRINLRSEALLPVILPAATFIAILTIWEFLIAYMDVPSTTLPRPTSIYHELQRGLVSGVLLVHTWITLKEVIYGFLLGAGLGLFFGVVLAEWKLVRMAIFPLIVAFQMIPKVAIAPLFVMWLGYGISSKVAIAASITFFPVVINTFAGLRSVDIDVLDMMRAFRASTLQTFWRVKIRYALPYIFAGLDVAIVLSVIGAIVAEFVGSTAGLGYLILQATYAMDTAEVFAVLAVLSVLGIGLIGILRLVARRIMFWHESVRSQI